MLKFVYHDIFNHKTFFPILVWLTQLSKHRIIIVCPYAYARRIERCIDYFAAAIARGVVICVILLEPKAPTTDAERKHRTANDQALEQLRAIGVHVSFKDEFHEKVAIFDELYICDGSLNFLSQNRSSERMNLFESPEMVREAIDFHEIKCKVCASLQLSDDPLESLRLAFINRRKDLKLEPCDLAQKTSISQRTIERFEKGNSSISLEYLSKLALALGMFVMCVPTYMNASLDQRLRRQKMKPVVQAENDPGHTKFLGAIVGERRRHHLLSQAELAAKASVSRTCISDFERVGTRMTLGRFHQLCQQLDIQIRLVPVDMRRKVDSDVREGFDTMIAHYQKVFEGIQELMHSMKTFRLIRIGRTTPKQKRA